VSISPISPITAGPGTTGPGTTGPGIGTATPARILAAAEQCLRRLGLRHLSMGDVARAAGVSRGSVYRYFPDRDALLDAVLERAADRFVAGSEPWVRRRRTLANQVAEAAVFIRTHLADEIITLHLPSEDESLLATMLTLRTERVVGKWIDFWLPLLADAAARGEIRADLHHRRAAEWIVRQLLSLVLMPSVVIDLDDPDQVREFVHDHIVRGLAP